MEDRKSPVRLPAGILFVDDLLSFPLVQEARACVPYSLVKRSLVLPVEETEAFYVVAHAGLQNGASLDELQLFLSRPIKEVQTSAESLRVAIERCYQNREALVSSELDPALESTKSALGSDREEVYDLLSDSSDSSAVVLLFNDIVREAVQQGASDIHFESTEQGLQVRYRVDGVLNKRLSLTKGFQAPLLSRIKVLSRLDIAEHRLPQDGRMQLNMGGRAIDFRVSTIPTAYGERAVLRILDRANVHLGLDRLGMSDSMLRQFISVLGVTEGIVLVTGPTGSGKTTTLYSMLSYLGEESVNIMTIEDPIEYNLPNMAQMGVNPKIDLTFSKGLVHILRQDPDIIMIGEIRDRDTAEIAIQAALTGHLVVSTLHTNDAPTALTRLCDMGIEPFLITSTVRAVVAQRLLRVLCPACSTPCRYSVETLQSLSLAGDEDLCREAQGCPLCLGSGFKGRRGIYELMIMTEPIKKAILSRSDATALQKLAIDDGMQTLRNDGARLVALGVTTPAELFRVTRSLVGD